MLPLVQDFVSQPYIVLTIWGSVCVAQGSVCVAQGSVCVAQRFRINASNCRALEFTLRGSDIYAWHCRGLVFQVGLSMWGVGPGKLGSCLDEFRCDSLGIAKPSNSLSTTGVMLTAIYNNIILSIQLLLGGAAHRP